MRMTFFLPAILSCCFSLSSLQGEIPMNTSCFREVEASTSEVALQLAKQLDMDWIGGGYLKIAFAIKCRMDKAQARKLITVCTERFLTALDHNESLKNCHPQGFTERDIEIEIYARGNGGYRLYEPYVNTVSTSAGYVFFRYDIPMKRYAYGYSDEESLDLSSPIDFPEKPPIELPNPTKLIRNLKKQYAPYDLELEGYGWSSKNLSLGLTINHPISVTQARCLALQARDIAIEAQQDEGADTIHPKLDIAIYSYESRQTKFAPNWTHAPYVEFVSIEGDKVIYGFLDKDHKRHRIDESSAAAEQLNAGADITDAATAFASHVSSE